MATWPLAAAGQGGGLTPGFRPARDTGSCWGMGDATLRIGPTCDPRLASHAPWAVLDGRQDSGILSEATCFPLP